MIGDRVKRAMASIEQLRRELNSVDEAAAEIDAVQGILDAKRAELAEVEQRLARTKQEAGEADAQLSLWRTVNAKEVAKGNALVDELHGKLDVLETEIADRRAQSENILKGISALNDRLNVQR